ncbi:MAG: hypothetical protein ACERKN_19285 [Velocimicrobium sp.]
MEKIKKVELTQEGTKILPVKEPIITTYTQHAHMMTILSNNPETIEWIISHYTLLYYNKNLANHNWADFYFPHPYDIHPFHFCRWIQCDSIYGEEIVNGSESIIDYIIKWIDEERYVDIMLNYFYIRNNLFFYQKQNGCHEVLVYGYNLSEKVFYCSDFLLARSHKYTFSTITFEDMENAFNPSIVDEVSGRGSNQIYLVRLKKQIMSHFRESSIVNSLRKYYKSEIPEYWEVYNTEDLPRIEFGLDGYNALLRNIDIIEGEWCEPRTYYLMYDHKHLMVIRLKYLIGLHSNYEPYYKKLCAEYKKIEGRLKAVILLMVKYNYHKSNSIMNEIQENLLEAEVQERKALQEFFACIDQEDKK